jgi:EAL domain-containing protein (putative c-di-GMP-specific phosphodiesterase class I)/AmiR/NasT family two-component response regulator
VRFDNAENVAPSRAAEPRVLLVDDDPAVLRVTRRRLERLGYAVVACGSGAEALQSLERESFDVIVSDVHMPGMGGLRLLRLVRERDLDLPVVLVTGNPHIDSASAAIEHGAFQYLMKPIGEELGEVVGRASNIGRMARTRREYVEEYGSGTFPIIDRAGVDVALDRALASMWMAFQPIIDHESGEIFAQEALLRSAEPALPHATAMIEAAERGDRLDDLGREVRSHVAEAIRSQRAAWSYFVNLHPRDLLDPALYDPEAPLSLEASRVVLEITERASLDALPNLRDRVAQLRTMGFRIALDDLGAGYAGLSSFVCLEPEFVKLDMSLIRDIHQSDAKRKIVGTMVDLCHQMGQRIIAEGVELAAERDALIELGCDLLQGFLFARPDRPFAAAGTAIALGGRH